MYNLNENNIPASFKRMFKKNNTVHNYSTRQANDFHIPKARTNFISRNFMFTGPKFWNSLDQSLKEACSLNSFKYRYRYRWALKDAIDLVAYSEAPDLLQDIQYKMKLELEVKTVVILELIKS